MNTLVLEETPEGDAPLPLYQKLSNDRILFLTEELSDRVASDLAATLMLKDAEDPEKKVSLFINCNGGDIRNIFMIYDVISMMECDVETICLGECMNEAVLLLAAGNPGMRFATPHSIIGLSPIVQDFVSYGNMTGVRTLHQQLHEDHKRFIKEMKECSSKSIEEEMNKKSFLTPPQAMKFNIIDKIIRPKAVVKPEEKSSKAKGKKK